MHRIGIIGEKSSILGFHMAGMEIRPVEHVQDAVRTLHKMVDEGFAVIFITEQTAEKMQSELDTYRTRQLPVILPLPGNRGRSGLGMSGLKSSIERAIGADILFRD